VCVSFEDGEWAKPSHLCNDRVKLRVMLCQWHEVGRRCPSCSRCRSSGQPTSARSGRSRNHATRRCQHGDDEGMLRIQTREHFCLARLPGPNHLTPVHKRACMRRHWLRRLGMTRSGQAGILAVATLSMSVAATTGPSATGMRAQFFSNAVLASPSAIGCPTSASLVNTNAWPWCTH
jgi:hypothetical protein